LNLHIGLKGEAGQVVTEHDIASTYGSGLVDAYSTPALTALIERACVNAIQNFLGTGDTSVGVEVSLKHLAPTPVGMRVRAHSELVEIDGRRLRFKVKAADDKEIIGEGSHVRVVVSFEGFAERVRNKLI